MIVALCVAAVFQSCQKLNEVFVGKSNVVFSIEAPGAGAGTRANVIGDGENVDIVYYEIYKDEAKHKNSVDGGSPLIEGSVKVVGKSASLSVNLLKDQKYVALFWAQVNGHADEFYDTKDLRKVKVSYKKADGKNALANDEDRAAFCQRKDFGTGDKDPRTVDVELERPFAQINFGTIKESLKLDYQIVLEKSRLTVAGAGTVFDVAKMMATSDYTHVDFDFNSVPQQSLSVGNLSYAYAGMNYILVPANMSNVKLTYEIMTNVGNVTRTIEEVPVEMNYRTNLLGNLLTQEYRIEIVVDEEFAGVHNVDVK